VADSRSSRRHITTGLAADFIRELALGAEVSAISNSAMQSTVCLGMRDCGHDHPGKFCIEDLTTWDREMAYLPGIESGGSTLN
jgi:glutamate synthase domain-containing protein 2